MKPLAFVRASSLLAIGLLAGAVVDMVHSPAQAQSSGNAIQFQLPFSGGARHDGPVFHVQNISVTDNAIGLQGEANFIGVLGRVPPTSKSGIGVAGQAGVEEKTIGVYGRSLGKGIGIDGNSVAGVGVKGTNGEPRSPNTLGTLGDLTAGVKGYAKIPTGNAVFGQHAAGPFGFLGSKDIGVEGKSEVPGGMGVAGRAEGGENSVGVYGASDSGIAGFFRGRVTITESLLINEINVKKLFGAAKLFRIDHPLEPATKYLSHASVESNEMTNLYSGNVVLNSDGGAWVELPGWFEALNGDFQYQLTCVGQFASVYVAQEIKDSRFRIAGGRPGLKVSWQVTAVRKDAYAKAHPLHVEEEKAPQDRGRYLNPVELGFAASRGIGYRQVSPLRDELPHLARADRAHNSRN
jgi:hypothetical protein